MHLCEYQDKAEETAIFPGRGEATGLYYAALGLSGESGEVANKVKKIIRDESNELPTAEELGDVLWYVAVLASEIGVSLESVAGANIQKLRSRMDRGVISGQGDHR